MALRYKSSILVTVVLLTISVSATSSPFAGLDSNHVQLVLENTCQCSPQLVQGKDDCASEKGWTAGFSYSESLGAKSLLASEPSTTSQPPITATDQMRGPITARAMLQQRQIAALFGVGPTTGGSDMNSQINAAKSEASVVYGASISQLSDQFQASMQSLKSSANSAVSSAQSVASSASLSASVAASQAMESMRHAGVAASAAAASASLSAQQQAAFLQTQSEAVTKIAIAVVVSTVASSFFSVLGFCCISCYRKSRTGGNNGMARRHNGDEKRESYRSDDRVSYVQRPRTARQSTLSRSQSWSLPPFRAIDEQRNQYDFNERKAPTSVIHELNVEEQPLKTAVALPLGSVERNMSSSNPPQKGNTGQGLRGLPKFPGPWTPAGDPRKKHVTPTFVSRHNRVNDDRVPQLPTLPWIGRQEKIGVAS